MSVDCGASLGDSGLCLGRVREVALSPARQSISPLPCLFSLPPFHSRKKKGQFFFAIDLQLAPVELVIHGHVYAIPRGPPVLRRGRARPARDYQNALQAKEKKKKDPAVRSLSAVTWLILASASPQWPKVAVEGRGGCKPTIIGEIRMEAGDLVFVIAATGRDPSKYVLCNWRHWQS